MTIKYLWDSFRWRFVAAFHIAWWFAKGAPLNMEGFGRWEETKIAWIGWKVVIMFPHNKDKVTKMDEWLQGYKDKGNKP